MIAIIGGGVVGVSTAYHLAQAGHAVTVIERDAELASECSFGNAGVIALGHAESWAGPRAPRQMARALAGRDPAVRVTRAGDPRLWSWGLRFLSQCTGAAHRRNSDRLMRLSVYSRAQLQAIEAAEGLDYHQRHDGAYYLYTDRAQFHARRDALAGNADFVALDRHEVVAQEPALAGFGAKLAGALRSTIDSSGECPRFTRDLAARLEVRGQVRFRTGCRATGFRRAGGRIVAILTDQGEIPCETVVLAAASATPALAAKLGFAPAIYPVKGYSATYPIRDAGRVPARSFVDETSLVGVSRFGDRLRVAWRAEFAGHDTSVSDKAAAVIADYARQRFGDAIDIDGGLYWAGLRPTTPGGAPYLGRVRTCENLWINAGHGQLGWTMAAGAGRVLADLMGGQVPAVRDVSHPARWLEAA